MMHINKVTGKRSWFTHQYGDVGPSTRMSLGNETTSVDLVSDTYKNELWATAFSVREGTQITIEDARVLLRFTGTAQYVYITRIDPKLPEMSAIPFQFTRKECTGIIALIVS